MRHESPASTTASLRRLVTVAGVLLCLALSGCAPLALSLVGAGAGAGISHQVNGVAARTFSEPLPRLKKASLMAARRMDFQFDATDATDKGQALKGRVADLDVSVDLEILSPAVTRVSVSARKNLLMLDGATAQEVIVQIERALSLIEQAEAAEAREAQEMLAAQEAQARATRLDNARAPKSRSRPRANGAI